MPLHRYLMSSVATFALTCAPALAQDTPDDAYDLGTIVLKGELQARSIESSSTSAVVETGKELEKRGDADLYDIVNRTPNVSATFGNEKGFSIRGISQVGPTGGNPQSLLISTQVDGVALPSSVSTFFGPFSTWDLDQVEILRGPQSTQQGRNAMAGAIILRSNDPTFDQEFKIHAEAGTRGHQRTAFMANTPLIDEKLAFRFSADRSKNDGYIYNPTLGGDEFDARESNTYRAKLLWNATDDVEVILSYSFAESYGGEDFVLEPPFPQARVNFSDFPSREGSEHQIYGLRVNWDINDVLRLESETSYYTHDYVRLEDGDNTAEPLAFLDVEGKSDVFEQDLRLKFDTDRARGVVGLFYTEIEDNNPFNFTTDLGFFTGIPFLAGTVVSRVEDAPYNTKNFAIFGETDIYADGILPGLSFTVGARYDYEEYDFQNTVTYDPELPFPPLNLVNSEFASGTDYDAFLPKFGVNYDINEDQFVSFTVQRGYRAGGAQFNPIQNRLNEYDPEYSNNYELAYRGAFYDDTLRISANTYFTQWEDQQVQVQSPTGGIFDFDLENAAESETYGAELTVEGEPTNNLHLFGSIGYAKTRFLDFLSPSADDPTRNLRNNQFPQAPEWTAAFGGQYKWDSGISLGADVAYTAATYFDAANTVSQRSDDYWLTNAQLVYENDDYGFTTGLFVRNLFDESYATQRIEDAAGNSLVRVGEPSTWGVFATKTF